MVKQVKKQEDLGEKSQRGIYMSNRIWKLLDKLAKENDRSVNWTIESALKQYYDNLL